MRTLVCAIVLVCLAASGAVAQESKEQERGEVTRTGAINIERTATIASGLTGCWATGVSDPWLVWLVQRGNRVWGYYVPNRPNRSGYLHGTLKGNRLDYYWWENKEDGQGYFELADDGRSMEGKWHYDFTRSWGGKWGLTRTIGTTEAVRGLRVVEGAVNDLRARTGALATGFQEAGFKADPRKLLHDPETCCAAHAKRVREAIPTLAEAVANYTRTAKNVDGFAASIGARIAGHLGQLKVALETHERAKYLPAANRAMEHVKRVVRELDNTYVWLEASLAIETACRRLRIHLAAPEETQDQGEFKGALALVRQTADMLQAHYRATEDPVGIGLAGQMAQIATELEEVVVAGLEGGGELRTAALAKVRAGYAALLAKKREIDVCCGTTP